MDLKPRGSDVSSLWSNLSSSSSRAKKEVVQEVEEPEEEEAAYVVEYEDEELEELVKKVKKMVRLFDLCEEDWNDDVYETIRAFFLSSEHLLLCIFFDESTLKGSLGPPLVPVHDLTYYVKYADPKRPVVAKQFFKSIQFGTLSGNIEGNILKIMQYVFAPQLFLGNRLTGSVKCDLLNDTHTFLANLTEIHHKLGGLTVLYIPLEGADMTAKEASEDKELTRRLEAVCVKWNTQIRVALNDEDEATQTQRQGPGDEYDFWVDRCDNLAGLVAQMENSQLKHVASILNAASSAYIRTFASLAADVQTALELATSNVQFLQLLTAPCARLAMEKSPETFPGHVSKILQALRVIWTHSEFYRSSKSRITALCHDLGSQVILQCRQHVDLPAIFRGMSRHGEASLRRCIDCCKGYKIAYLSCVAAFEEMPGGSWDVDNVVVFTHVDSFVQRCEDMIEVCNCMALFARMDEMEEIPKPRFSGARGPEFELICHNVETYFKQSLEDIEKVLDTILNVEIPSWYHDMKRFRHDVKNIVGMIEKLAQEVFEQACDPCEAIDSLQAMYYYSKYPTLKPLFEKKTVDVYMWIITEIQDTLKELQTYPDYRHHFTPRYAGRVQDSRGKHRWVAMQVQRMMDAQWMSNREYRAKVAEHFANLTKLVTQIESQMLAEWKNSLHSASKFERLNRPLMCHSHAKRGQLEVNVDRTIFELLDETRFWERLQVDLPPIAKQMYPLSVKLKRLYMRVLTVVQDYNRLVGELSNEERVLFQKLIEVCDKKIDPGMNKLRWDTDVADDYIIDCCNTTKDLQEFVLEYKEACALYVSSCEKICDMKIIQFPPNEPFELAELDHLMRVSRSSTLMSMLDEYQNLQRCLVRVRDGFSACLPGMIPQWRRFLVRLDDVLEESLRICTRTSMQVMVDALHGPSAAGPVPIIKIRMHLSKNQITFTPSLIDVDNFVGNAKPNIVEGVEMLPRIYERFKMVFSDREPFHRVIDSDPNCLDLQNQCDYEMDMVMEEMAVFIRVWDPFREVWEMNKDLFISRYEKAMPNVETFDEDISHYVQVAIDVQQLESNTEIRFLVINSDQLKTSVMRHCSEWQNRLTSLLARLTEQRVVEHFKYTATNTEKLLLDPADLAELATSVSLFEQLTAEVPEREAELPLAKDMLRVLNTYKHALKPELLDLLAAMDADWQEYLIVLEEAEKTIIKNKEKFRTGLIGAAKVLETNAADAWNKYQLQGPFTSAWAPVDALAYLKDLRAQMEEFRRQEAQLSEDLKLFNVTLPVNQDLLRLERDLEALEIVWELAYEWELAWASYKTGGFWTIETEEMEVTAQTLFRKLTRLSRELKEKNWEIVGHTRQLVDEFRRTLPLIADLKNTALRDRHWERVKVAMNRHFDHNSPDFTLEAIISMNMQEWAEDISEISNAATMELSIENGIKAIAVAWKDINLDMVQHKDKPMFRLKAVDDIFQVLEEHQMALSAMKSTRFVEPFAKVVDTWERTLSLVMEVLEMFLIVQRQWLYLENIFGGEDIRKQLPMETEVFDELTKFWSETTVRMNTARNALKATQAPGMYKTLCQMNDKLEGIQRALEKYLETKRHIFPRFYFISNDDLLEILAQSKRPDLVQPHLKKCFDNVNKLKMNKLPGAKFHGSAIISADGESVELKQNVELDGPVELWLCGVEDAMRVTLRDQLRQTRAALKKNLAKRDKWIKDWPGQMCITASQIQWTTDCQRTLMLCKLFGKRNPMKKLRKKMNMILNKFSEAICGQLSKIQRLKVVALVTIEIHARDVIDKMYRVSCTDVNAFEWLSQLRFYWDRELDNCLARQTNTCFRYAYEYLGNSGRLVITPLTDRCYITLTTALHLYRGGSPKGPAGTGKTETVKDLGKGLGMYVIVVNCSEGLDYKSMGRMFSGLAQTGAWGCFDEFNRINIEVLSVVAQQILSILSALAAKLKIFIFESAEIQLVSTCGVFITMNPGYAGRTELPDNLKSMFRPISMIVPDSAMISEIILFGEGFKNTRALAKKVYTLYQLAMQQLSKQDHYDFGLRGMVALLRYAGRKRRAHPHLPNEEVILLAMKDMNVAKLTADDLPLFNGITNDLFPGIEVPKIEYEDLGGAIITEFKEHGLQPIPAAVVKVIQLYETKNSRHSVMIVGRTGSGKTVTWKTLKYSLSRLRKEDVAGYNTVREFPINPKALSLGELYGEFNLSTNEWLDGVLSAIMRKTCAEETPDEKWIVFDGPVDAVWIENMNSVMDDNKVLTLINSERIVMPEQVSLLFEVEDLAVASPATVSRCGMVYNDHKDLGWRPHVDSWLQRHTHQPFIDEMDRLFVRVVNPVLEFKRHHCQETVPVNELNAVMSLCKLLDCLVTKANGVDEHLEEEVYLTMLKLWFLFCSVWSLCASVDEDGRRKMDLFVREMEGGFPLKDTIYEYFVDSRQRQFALWENKLEDRWIMDKNQPFFKIIVPTVDTVRYQYLVGTLLNHGHPGLVVGPVGTGKTSTSATVLEALDPLKYCVLMINMSAQTTSNNVQDMIESRLEKRTKGVFVPAGGKTMVTFMDDLNMPAKETYGSQPPLELIRQWVDYGFWYDRQKQEVKHVKEMLLMAAMGPPGGGRNVITNRLLSRFNVINMTFPSNAQIQRIFGTMLDQQFMDFPEEVKILAEAITKASIDLYTDVVGKMLPTPTKTHYLFNLRDISKIFQGLLRSHRDYQDSKVGILRLWIHESFRVFSDRLIDERDLEWFVTDISETLGKHFDLTFHNICQNKESPIFGDFVNAYNVYEDLNNLPALRKYIELQLEEYNVSPGVIRMDLVLFKDAIDHVCRVVRVISQPRGNMLLVGIGGSGRQSLSRIAAYICEYNTFQIEVTKNYRVQEFREDLKTLYRQAGVEARATTFLFNDTQIADECFLEIINNVLSSGEVPNLYKPDEFEEVKGALQKAADKEKIAQTSEAMYTFLIDRVRANLHIVLCMSPIGDSFRNRLRQYPSIVNCTTIDWFHEWPEEALLEVANKYLVDVNFLETITVIADKDKLREAQMVLEQERLRLAVASIFATIHESVSRSSRLMMHEMKRPNYVTPTNYLELVAGYKSMLDSKRVLTAAAANKLRSGLHKIDETREKVGVMAVELEVAKKQVMEVQVQCEEYMVIIMKQKQEADEQQVSVAARSIKIMEEEVACKKLADAAQADLNEAMPALEEAMRALDALNKKDLTEIRSYGRPPTKVEMVMEAVMIMKKVEPTWAEAKRQLGEQNFLKDLRDFDKDNVSDRTMKKIATYTKNPEFEPEKVGIVSLAAKSLCLWVRAIEKYAKLYRIVAPKRQRLDEAMSVLLLKQKSLADAKAKLEELAAMLEKLKREYDEKLEQKEELRKKAELLEQKLERAAQLVDGLAGEKIRWEQTVRDLDSAFDFLPGDCLVATGFVSYLGPFVTHYRDGLVSHWTAAIKELEVPISRNLSIMEFLSDPTTIREWNIQGLPSDDFSTENGIIVTRAMRWPLLIDPQCQGMKWIKSMEGPRDLKVIDFGQLDFMRTLEVAIQLGHSVLLQNVMEVLDPSLEPVLNKSFVKQGGQILLKINDKMVTYNDDFRFFITTKLSNPHYPPEISTKTTLVNFAVKEQGLQAQLLGIVVRKEKPILEEQKDSLVMNIATGKRTLKDLEDNLLRLLNEAKGSLLDDLDLLITLQTSKATSTSVAVQLAVSEVTEVEIDTAREGYRSCSERATILFFVLTDMSRIDPMYQFSLDSYIALFTLSIEKSKKTEVLEDRITFLNEYHTYSVYRNTCRGLFESHKLLFSFHMCIKVLEALGKVSVNEYDFLLKGGVVLDRENQAENPCPAWMTDVAWDNITELDKISGFHGVVNTFETYPRDWMNWYTQKTPEMEPLIGEWDGICSEFQRMLFVRSLRPDRITACVTTFIVNTLGPQFVEPPVLDIRVVLEDSSCHTPLIFVLSPGVDPTTALIQLADHQGMSDHFHSLSLGQGQAPIATKLIQQGARDGDWVFLANCHLSLSWMPKLDKIVETLQTAKVSPSFRLWLSSSPHPDFPISILQAGIKMTTEPPKGIKANLKRLYQLMSETQFEMCQNSIPYRRLLFSLCFFHSVLLERKKFQKLGWNVIYSFNDSDFEVSENLLSIYLDEYSEVPWDALKYLIADVNYGGHVTDDWDRRLLTTYINLYFNERVVDTLAYRLSTLPTYFIPRDGLLSSYLDFITTLPNVDQPEAFGQHSNADITSLITVTRSLFETLMSLQVQASQTGGESQEEKVQQLAADILSKIPRPIDFEQTEKLIGETKTPLDVVLLQEIARYNVLLVRIRSSLEDLQRGILGLVVMSVSLEDIFICIYEGRVPQFWLKAYPSLKLLGSWTRDLVQRVEHFSIWAETTHPPVFFWLSAYTFPTGFLTAVLQTSARSANISIDSLSWDFTVFTPDERQRANAPVDGGVYIRGLFLEGAGWDRKNNNLIEPMPMQLVTPMPIIHFKPVEQHKKRKAGVYSCPSYYYPVRCGDTGRPAFVVAVDLKGGDEPADHWIKRATALLLSLAN